MAEMRREVQSDSNSRTQAMVDVDMDDPQSANSKIAQRQPAGMGKLQEIDLGPDTALLNIARTEAAQRRLEAGHSAEPESDTGKKVRLGRDGRPWRGRKRRTSEDLKRDKLVEEVLRETRCKFGSTRAAATNLYLRCTLSG